MQINHSKTVAMTITRKNNPLSFTYSISGSNLSAVSNYKYLGVVISADLRWNDHVTCIHKKAIRQLGYLRRTLSKASRDVKLLAYKTYIRAALEYAAAVWDPHTNLNISKLENIQRKAARFIFNSYSWKISPSSLLISANLEYLQVRRYRERLKIFYMLYHDKLGIHKSMYLKPLAQRSTRSFHSKKVSEISCKTNSYMNSFFPPYHPRLEPLAQRNNRVPFCFRFYCRGSEDEIIVHLLPVL
uniref:Rna-directed dna polymerase from mobile element jockey-like protein n=1 Tax=Rhipicephalus zambeziensis TaxID=60191 RepID=A0A224Z8C0_9ACAR